MDNLLNMDSEFLKNIFNTFPSPLFVVDADVRIAHYNTAASALMNIDGSDVILERSGDILGCVHAQSSNGCGTDALCKDCVIRNAVQEALGGTKVFRSKTRIKIQSNKGEQEFHYLITTAPFYYNGEEFVLLIMEDISELIELRGLIPICSCCKKVRKDDDYWESVEGYFRSHADVKFTHGMCDECSTKEHGKMKDHINKLKE